MHMKNFKLFTIFSPTLPFYTNIIKVNSVILYVIFCHIFYVIIQGMLKSTEIRPHIHIQITAYLRKIKPEEQLHRLPMKKLSVKLSVTYSSLSNQWFFIGMGSLWKTSLEMRKLIDYQ